MTRAPLLIVVGMNSEARIVDGMGRVVVGAHAAREAMADGARGVLSFGLCGALDPALRPGDLVIGTEVRFERDTFVADADWLAALRSALPAAVIGPFAGSDRIVASRADKVALAARTGAIAVDMESRAVAEAAVRHGLAFAVVRAVSDAAGDSLPQAAQAGFRSDGKVDIVAILRTLAARPWELPALIRTGRDASSGFKALKKVALTLSPPTPAPFPREDLCQIKLHH